jgi:hypothetical protein
MIGGMDTGENFYNSGYTTTNAGPSGDMNYNGNNDVLKGDGYGTGPVSEGGVGIGGNDLVTNPAANVNSAWLGDITTASPADGVYQGGASLR